MAPVRRILGVIVVLLGIVIVALPFLGANAQSTTAYPLSSERISTVTPTLIGGGTLTVSWSGAGAGTVVTLYDCGSACPLDSSQYSTLGKAGTGSGSSGSFSASVNGGTTYGLVENGTADGLVTTTTESGLVPLSILGIVLAVIGVVLIVLPQRKSAGETEVTEEEPSEDEGLGAPMPPPVPAAPVMTPVPPQPRVPVPAPVEAEPEEEPAPLTVPNPVADSTATASQANARGRPNLTCAHCGAINEPWITNCRRCHRPLSATG